MAASDKTEGDCVGINVVTRKTKATTTKITAVKKKYKIKASKYHDQRTENQNTNHTNH